MKPVDPPRLIERFFNWFCHHTHQEGLEGDLYEMFEQRVRQVGPLKAKWYYIRDVMTLLRRSVAKEFFKNSNSNTMGLLNHYVRTTIRSSKNRRTFSLINLFGLTMGITCVSFILIFLQEELSYDQHTQAHEKKYRFYNESHKMGEAGSTNLIAMVPPMFASDFRTTFPQIEKIGRAFFDYGGTMFTVNGKIHMEENGFFMEHDLLEILDFQMTAGSYKPLNEPRTMIISQSLFQKFFPDQEFKEQTVELSRGSLKIVGIYADFPRNTHLRPDYVFSFETLKTYVPEERMNSWVWQQFYTYLQLRPDADPVEFQTLIRAHVEKIARPFTEEYSYYYIPYIQKLTDIHLKSQNIEWEVAEVGNGQSILFLSFAAAIILFIACLNFINLTTAMSLRRAKEVGVRKFIGASKKQLLAQYTLESIFYTLLAGLLSIGLMALLLPYFNQLSGKSFTFPELITVQNLIIYFIGLTTLGLVAGWYPAMMITKFEPITALHGRVERSLRQTTGFDLKQVLIGMQYVLSIGLILVSIVIQKQHHFLLNTDMGLNKENLLMIRLTRSLAQDIDQTKAHFSDHSNIQDITFCYGMPGGIVAGDGIIIPRLQDKEITSSMFLVAPNYLDVLEMEMVAGRAFSKDLESDVMEAFILNETAVHNFGLGSPEEAIGEAVNWKMWTQKDTLKRGRVIGVVRDFNFKSLHSEVSSAVLHIAPDEYQFMLIKTGAGDVQSTIAFLEHQYRDYEATRPFDFEFMDASFQRFYDSEQKLSNLISIFTILSILTAAIGLFGLVSFNVANKGKELSIRKVLGARSDMLFLLLVKKYFTIVGLCLLIALPASYYIVGLWLDDYAYRTEVEFFTYIQVVLVVMLLTFMAVGFQAWKGVKANPASRLRME